MEFELLNEGKAKEAIGILEREYKDAHYYLDFKTPVDLVAAAILSAQARDEVINSVTPELFRRFKTADDYAGTGPEELIKYIGRITFAGNKARNITKTFKVIKEKYGGKVPDKMEQLIELPGIGRKTANTILINAYGIVEGIPVDTWVIKLSGRIGLSKSKDPEEIEKDLMKTVDRRYWKNIAYVFKSHGRKICQSQVPICSACVLNRICPRNGVTKSR
ncbi:MAG: endonuclease III [Candidatus Micrarchaeota archaeon]|nr:endonuclease III [Candidatus Micrarchaeota archaeon]MDE1850033.1 endonuclease III [Candidatus Micrarchaeota archaeon]